MAHQCKICGNEDHNTITRIKGLLWKSEDAFDYLECGKCGCLQLLDENIDLSKYYANDTYPSFQKTRYRHIRKWLKKKRNDYAILKKKTIIGQTVNRYIPVYIDYTIIGEYARKNSRIIDVGCGIGEYLQDLYQVGFHNIRGIDPFIEKNTTVLDAIPIEKRSITEDLGSYDVILMRHSFEHVPNPHETFQAIRRLLADDGICLITIPIKGELFRIFGEFCYTVQAPQHLFMHTLESIRYLADESGLEIERIERSEGATFSWIVTSALWKKGILEHGTQENFDKYLSQDEKDRIIEINENMHRENIHENVTFVLRGRAG